MIQVFHSWLFGNLSAIVRLDQTQCSIQLVSRMFIRLHTTKTVSHICRCLNTPESEPYHFDWYCDCSGYSIGFLVTQTSNNVERVCLYGGRGLSLIEKRYGITDQEMTAVRYGLQKNLSLFRYSKVEIITDHSAIKFILDQPSPNGRHSRFIAFLSSFRLYNFPSAWNSKHLKVPDALSRRVYESQSTDDEADEFLQGFDIIESKPHEFKDRQTTRRGGRKI